MSNAVSKDDVRAMFARMDRVADKALSVWKSDEAADRFMNRPHMLLGGQTPTDRAIDSEEGAEEVIQILIRLQHNSAV